MKQRPKRIYAAFVRVFRLFFGYIERAEHTLFNLYHGTAAQRYEGNTQQAGEVVHGYLLLWMASVQISSLFSLESA